MPSGLLGLMGTTVKLAPLGHKAILVPLVPKGSLVRQDPRDRLDHSSQDPKAKKVSQVRSVLQDSLDRQVRLVLQYLAQRAKKVSQVRSVLQDSLDRQVSQALQVLKVSLDRSPAPNGCSGY